MAIYSTSKWCILNKTGHSPLPNAFIFKSKRAKTTARPLNTYFHSFQQYKNNKMDLNFYLPISFQESSHVKEAKNGVNQA